MDVLKDLKYQSEYSVILLMGISKTSDFGRFFMMKESKDGSSFNCALTHENKVFKVSIILMPRRFSASLCRMNAQMND